MVAHPSLELLRSVREQRWDDALACLPRAQGLALDSDDNSVLMLALDHAQDQVHRARALEVALQVLHHFPQAADRANRWKTTPLMLAANLGDVGLVRTLLEPKVGPWGRIEGLGLSGEAVQSSNHVGTTALMMASEQGHGDVVDLLLPLSDPRARNDDHACALMLASGMGHETIVPRLLPLSDVTTIDRHGDTALTLAIDAVCPAMVQTLLDAGASLALPNAHRSSYDAVNLLQRFAGTDMATLTMHDRTLFERMLEVLSPVSDPLQRDGMGLTALMRAVDLGHKGPLHAFLNRGVDLEQHRTTDGDSLLCQALRKMTHFPERGAAAIADVVAMASPLEEVQDAVASLVSRAPTPLRPWWGDEAKIQAFLPRSWARVEAQGLLAVVQQAQPPSASAQGLRTRL